MPRFPYIFFDNFVVRIPILSKERFKKNFSKKNIKLENLKISIDKTFREAIYLASLSLHKEFDKPANDQTFFQDIKLRDSLLKYLNRASNRSTPFGLFAGVCVGKFDNDEYFINLSSNHTKLRDTRLDMHFLVSLSKQLVSAPHIKNKINFFKNNTIYKVGNKIRFVEYENNAGKREYIISSAPLSEELEKVLDFSTGGKTIEQFVSFLINDEISHNEAKEYINELIENQVLVSELEPNVVGDDFLDLIISILSRIGANKEKNILTSIQKKIKNLDLNFGNSAEKYSEIENVIKSLNIEYDSNYIFQTDLYFNEQIQLSYNRKKELKKGISFLNRITYKKIDTSLEKFKERFLERFENEEIPLSYALDAEIGIGYLQNTQNKGIHPYIDDIILPANKKKDLFLKFNPVQVILNKKIQENILNREKIIKLTDDDFKGFNENWNDLPDTLSLIAEITSESNREKLFIDKVGADAGRLYARFCSEKSFVKNLVKEISNKQQELNGDKILAEIVHLPESRIGNVIRRPQLRGYEIPYLASSILPKENQILVDDLYLSLKNNRLFLRSKKHNKEVIPYLTNAHNYSDNSLPVYHFLCDYNSQNLRTSLSLDWGDLTRIYDFLPRVEYENIIFSKAKWKIDFRQIEHFYSIIKSGNKELLFQNIENWRKLRQIPQWIQLVEGDNTLVVNLKNYDLIHMFFTSIRNKKKILIEEFLCNDNNDYNHQFVFSLFKDL